MTRAEAAVLTAAAWVAAAATASLVLAVAGVHEIAPYIVGFLLVLALAAGTALVRRSAPDRTGALLALGAVVLGGVMFTPAYPYGSSDRDPGVYTYATYAIARTGSAYVPDPLAHPPAGLDTILDEQRVPGLHPTGDTALPGFFLTEPAFGATFQRVGGDLGRALMNPLVGVIALAALGLFVRRLAGPLAAAIAIALLAGSMIQVWQARVPGPEMLAQAGIAGALLAAAVGREHRAAATLSGVLTTFVLVARPDGLLAVLAGLAFGWRSRHYVLGLAAAAPVALWQTYAVAGDYAARNGIPPWWVLFCLVLLAVAGAEAFLRWPRVPGPRLLLGGTLAFVALLLLRQVLSPDPPPLRGGAAPKGYAPYTLSRIAGLVTWPGLALSIAGVYDAARRNAWLLLVPALLGAPYLVDPRISPDLMFWGRRFVPMLLPGVVVLAAVGATAALRHRRAAPLAALALGVAVALPYTQSVPLLFHREYDGTREAARIAADASRGEQAIYLWVRPRAECCDEPAYLYAGAVWLRYGKASMTMHPDDAERQAGAALALGRPVLVVAEGTAPPFAGLTAVAHDRRTVPVWERGGLTRPDRARRVPVEFTVWRYSATAP
ncbi:MAG TPA: hypothetical protein VNQ77_08690 [Frankiaceae bacterium]|nr:hypothetical protein [Frankiaceae bacterium]